MRTSTKHRISTVLAAAAMTTAVVATSTPSALADVKQIDRPRITTSGYDFGLHWTLGAPRDGGTLAWDLTDGVWTPELTGYLYLTDRHCAAIRVEYYDDDHDFLGSRSTAQQCAPGNGKTQFWVDVDSFQSQFVTHVHVKIVTPSGTLIGQDVEDFD